MRKSPTLSEVSSLPAIASALNNGKALKRYLEQGYLVIDNNLSARTLRASAGIQQLGRARRRDRWADGSGAVHDVGTCKHLGIDLFAYLKEALPGLFALGEKPTTEPLVEWLPDRWLLRRRREMPPASAGTE